MAAVMTGAVLLSSAIIAGVEARGHERELVRLHDFAAHVSFFLASGIELNQRTQGRAGAD
jgi:hypothetical protein